MIVRSAIVVGVLLGLAGPASAARILDAGVTFDDGQYEVRFVVVLDGERARLRQVLTDYPGMSKLSPTMTRSRVIHGAGAGRAARIELTFRPCVLLVFCKTLTKVSNVHIEDEGNMMTFVAVPELSHFHEAREAIALADVSVGDTARVRFTYSAVLRPKFNIPSLVGPWLIKRRILGDLEATTRNVERLMRGAAAVDRGGY